MVIVVFHLPFPMGNYKLNATLAEKLSSEGHEVYCIEQLNGVPYNDEYYEQIKSIEPDVLYYEMLDWGTFEVVEKFDCKKILNIMGTGVLKEDFHNRIKSYKDKWYNNVITNSTEVYELLKNNVEKIEHFKYYFCAIKDGELVKRQEYSHDCVFLGQGHHRLSMPEFTKELEIYFKPKHNFNFKVYGTGWPQLDWYMGVLPPDDIGSLYSSVKSAISVIEPEQYNNGMINNRYVELGFCKTPIITFQYPNIDWYGAEKFINIIDSYDEFNNLVMLAKNDDEILLKKASGMRDFVLNQNNIYFDKLKNIIGG